MGELLSGGCVLASNSRGNANTCPQRLPFRHQARGPHLTMGRAPCLMHAAGTGMCVAWRKAAASV